MHRAAVEYTCSDQWGMVVLMCDHWPLELAVNGHWYGVLEVRRSAETCSEG